MRQEKNDEGDRDVDSEGKGEIAIKIYIRIYKEKIDSQIISKAIDNLYRKCMCLVLMRGAMGGCLLEECAELD